MERIILALSLYLIVSTEALALPNPISRYFVRVPIDEAHSFTGFGKIKALDPDSIKAIVWNIKKAALDNWQKEFLSYGEDKDLFLIQEVYQTDRFNSTLEHFDHVRWDMGISFLYGMYNNTPTGSMIGSEVEPTKVSIKHSTGVEPVTLTPKAMTLAKYPIEGEDQELLVISIHAINFTALSYFKDQVAQAMQEIERHDGPVLFAGDFNTHNPARTKYLMTEMEKYHLKPVKFKNGHLRMKFAGNYLDHGFIRGLNVKDAEVFGDSSGSDHKPMVLELAFIKEIL